MLGTVKYFKDGRGVITADSDGKEFFVHYSNITMEGFKVIRKGDIVNFEIMENDKTQADKVLPILSYAKVARRLKKRHLYPKTAKDSCGKTVYFVRDENNVLKTPEQGFSLVKLAKYAGFDLAKQAKNEYERYMKRYNERKEYEEKLDSYRSIVKYPEYGAWCIKCVLDALKTLEIHCSQDYLENHVFNPDSEIYDRDGIEFDLENILYRLKHSELNHFDFGIDYFDKIDISFRDEYWKRYLELNEKIYKEDESLLVDLDEGEALDLLFQAFNEIKIDQVKEIILSRIIKKGV